MSVTPRFSAQRFTNVLSSATGLQGSALRGALSRIGQQGVVNQGTTTTTRDAKMVLRRLEREGVIDDARAAEATFRKAERVANVAARVQDKGRRDDRMAEYNKERMNDSVVREQKHSVSIFGDATSQHKVSAFGGPGSTPHVSVGGGVTTHTMAGVASGSPLQMAQPIILPPKPQIRDIPFD